MLTCQYNILGPRFDDVSTVKVDFFLELILQNPLSPLRFWIFVCHSLTRYAQPPDDFQLLFIDQLSTQLNSTEWRGIINPRPNKLTHFKNYFFLKIKLIKILKKLTKKIQKKLTPSKKNHPPPKILTWQFRLNQIRKKNCLKNFQFCCPPNLKKDNFLLKFKLIKTG